MKLHVIETGNFKLDGGAMFGVVPKVMWNKLNPSDENNLCTWSMRCLLLETADRKILFDTGMGEKQDAKFKSHFHPHGESDLFSSLSNIGLSPEDITDVFITHFHFDHVGGAITKDSEGNLSPAFSKAKYWTTEKHYNWAMSPNARERASFLKENFVPLKEAGVLHYISDEQFGDWIEGIKIFHSYGHTEDMIIPIIPLPNGGKLVYCADLLPSQFHIGMPYVMSYDIRPLQTLKEKKVFLDYCHENNASFFFEHDPIAECGTLTINEKGRYAIEKTIDLKDLLAT